MFKYSRLIFFAILGAGAYGVIIAGWGRARRFSKLGALRGILQSLSFEAALVVVFMFVLTYFSSFVLINTPLEELVLIWCLIIGTIALIERNRAPFDLLEGERELIRGFNVEIGRSLFVLIFLREYGMLIVISIILVSVLLANARGASVLFILRLLGIRRCYPRVRYDSLIRVM